MLTPDHFPEWWTQSAVFEYFTTSGRHYWIGFWNHAWVAIVIWASSRQTTRAVRVQSSARPRSVIRTPAVHRSFQLTNAAGRPVSVRPSVVGQVLALVQTIWFFLSFIMLDQGFSFYYTSAMWGVVALAYAWLMWAWRIHLRRSHTAPRSVRILRAT